MNINNFAPNLKIQRKARKLTQKNLSSKVFKSPDWVCHIETGRIAVKLEDALILCAVLEVSLNDMLK